MQSLLGTRLAPCIYAGHSGSGILAPVASRRAIAAYPGRLDICTRAQARRPATVASAAASSHSGDQAKSTPDKAYAFLHDFCLAIPYGLSLLATGVVAWITSSTSVGVALIAAGALTSGLSVLSLQCYNAGKKSTPFTAASAGVSIAAAVFSWQNFQRGISKVPSVVAVFLSAAAAAFLVYNVSAGGNPPKGEKPLGEVAPHSTS